MFEIGALHITSSGMLSAITLSKTTFSNSQLHNHALQLSEAVLYTVGQTRPLFRDYHPDNITEVGTF